MVIMTMVFRSSKARRGHRHMGLVSSMPVMEIGASTTLLNHCSEIMMRQRLSRVLFTCTGFLMLSCSCLAQVPPPDLNAYIEQVLKSFEVPGLAAAIVKDGKVVLAKGYGVRALGAPEKVDAHTLFGIASNTKAFTATALSLLVEEGKVDWDTPVRCDRGVCHRRAC